MKSPVNNGGARNGRMQFSRPRLSPTQFLVLAYIGVILSGTILLSLPQATTTGDKLSLVDALFTSTSAVCITGLTVVSTANDLSRFGQLVVLLLIQVGALGIMTMSTLFAMILGKRITLRNRLLMQEDLNQSYLSGLVRLVRHVLIVTVTIESAGALLLYLSWMDDYGPELAAYYAIFHSVSAFGNAGFDLFGNSFENFTGDVRVNLILSGLFILGGIGFSVIADLYNYRSTHRLSLHSRIVLRTTVLLIAVGTLFIFVLEYHNPATIGNLPWWDKLLASYFQAVTPRTAGFNTIPTGQMTSSALFFTMILMFIGASPGSTGGGIKTSTFGALVAAVYATIRGYDDVSLLERRLPQRVISKSLAIIVLSLALIIVMTMLLLIIEGLTLLPTLFEVVSAFGTVGLTTGITPGLSLAGKLVIIITMFAGRLGPMTLALALGQRVEEVSVRYPEEQVLVG